MNPPYDYRYITKDGGPPNGGAPPGRSRRVPPHHPIFPLCSHLPCAPSAPGLGRLYKCYGPCMRRNCPPTLPPFGVHFPPKSAPNPHPLPPCPLSRKSEDEMKAPPGAKHNGNGVRFPDGTGFIFPELTVLIHVIEKGVEPWKQPGRKFKFQAYWVSIKITVNELIRQLGAREGSRAEDLDFRFGLIEMFERGSGVWTTGSKFRLGELESSETLELKGWTENRGRQQRPVWIALFKD